MREKWSEIVRKLSTTSSLNYDMSYTMTLLFLCSTQKLTHFSVHAYNYDWLVVITT